MSADAWISVSVIAVAVLVMVRQLAPPDLSLLGALTALIVTGVLQPSVAFSGFANEGMLTIAVLFMVAAGVRETGALDYLGRRLLGEPRTTFGALLRMMLPMALISSVLNNTPVVAMMIPVVSDWARRIGISPSRLLLPLSYATILGGTLTLIGTSTNLVVAGMAAAHHPSLQLGIFDVTAVGAVVCVTGLLYLLTVGRALLPDRGASMPSVGNPREYSIAMRVGSDSPVVGQTIERAGLRSLPGLYLAEIEREGQSLAAVSPDAVILAGDHLLFVGVVESVVDLRKIRGLTPATDQIDKLAQARLSRRLAEAVIGRGSALIGKTVRESRFRTRYNAAIIAVHRDGERVHAKVGDIALQAGDTLLLETHTSFLQGHRHDRGFALVSEVEGSAPLRHERAGLSIALVIAMVVVSATGVLPLLVAGMLCVAAMFISRCLSPVQARQSLDLQVLLAIAAALGVGQSLEVTGAAQVLGAGLVELSAPLGTVGLLLGVYLSTMVLTELITNNAAAALLLPIALAAGEAADVKPLALVLIVMFAASASFATPIGYQTNLMVYGPGGYRFTDFIRVGAPLQLLLAAVTVTTVYLLHVL